MEQPSATASGESLCSRVSSAWTKLSKVGLCLLGSMLGRLDSIPLTHFGVHDLLLSPTFETEKRARLCEVYPHLGTLNADEVSD